MTNFLACYDCPACLGNSIATPIPYDECMSLPAWLPISISAAGVVISLSAFAYQVHRARFNQSVDLLFRLENDFFGAAKRSQRVKAARDLAAGKSLEAEPILDFFETVALLLRKKALDPEMVWHTFYYWIDNYYEVLQPYIAERQARDPLVWQDFVALVATVRSIQAERLGHASPASTETSKIAFLVEEQTEAF